MTQFTGEKKARIFQYALVLGGFGVMVFSVVRLGNAPGDTRWAWLAVCALLGSWLATSRVPGATKAVTVSDTFVFLATLLCGIDAGVVVAFLATAGDTARHTKRLLTAATNVAVICCSFFLSGWAVRLLFGDLRLLAHRKETFFLYVLALALFAVAQAAANGALIFTVVMLKTGTPLRAIWREHASFLFVTNFSGILTAGVVDGLIHAYGFWAAVFVPPLLLGTYFAYRPYIRNMEEARRHLEELQESEARLRRAFDYAPIGMALAEPTGRLAQVNRSLCQIIGYSEAELLRMNYHDFIEREGIAQAAAQVRQLLAGHVPSRQFAQADLISKIEYTLKETGLDARCLKLEVTESVVMENVETAADMLRQMRMLGIGLSLDDFGTGYSSLSYLHRFPLDTLKIDRSFVMQMAQHSENRKIVRTIASLAKILGLDVVAEGVETTAELAELKALACEYGQGYYFSRPVDEAAASTLIQKQRQWQIEAELPTAFIPLPGAGTAEETFIM